MIAKGYVTSVEEAFETYLSRGRPGYVPREGLGPDRGDPGDPRRRRSRRPRPLLARRPERPDVIRELKDAGLGGLEVYYRTFDAPTVEAVRHVARGRCARRDGWQRLPWRPRTVRRHARPAVGPAHRGGAAPGGPCRIASSTMIERPPGRDRRLPILEIAPPAPSAGRAAVDPEDARLGEFRPEPRALPAFYVWTLGCQMNRSDSEEMAGRLLAAGAVEAPTMEAADLVVINTCAIRELAEAKVIGRQGHLQRLKAANPSLRVVLTGCAVRERDRDGLERRYPAVDLFLRPDEEPELVDRLGLASAQGPVGAVGATTMVGRTVVGVADHLAATRAAAVAGGAVHRVLGRVRLAADHLRLRQDVHLLHRAVQPRPGAEPPVRRGRGRRPGRSRPPGSARSPCSART